MPLGPGTRLGSYEIVSLLGVGGMGEVYRARDPRLRREVALKVLPDIAASDPERRERFTREALAVAALNHPHIVTIHSVEDAGTSIFLTMELVEGRSLAEVLTPAGLPLGRVLTIGIAVAEAVAAAHLKGITHRDLKPGNIMLGEGEQAGRIKVLDFGLAKIVESPLSDSPASMLPTASSGPTPPATAEGRILGTVAYMSPEQAEGRAIDGRSDLFSLGVVLYEMATGQRPFTGDTNLSILSSILKDTPKPVTDINPALPSDLGRIIRRALAKDPERRYQSAKDLRNDLEDLKASIASGELAAQSSTAQIPASGAAVGAASGSRSGAASDLSAPSSVPAPSSDAQIAGALVRRHSRAVATGVVLLLVAAAALIVWLGRDEAELSEEATALSSLADLQITQLTTSGTAERPAISPDGRYVAYVEHDGDDDSLWIRQTTTTSNVQIVAPQPGVALFGATFTPDGTSVDFVRQAAGAATWDVWRVPFLGGTPNPLIADVASPISWSPDGQRLAFLRTQVVPGLTSQLFVANADGAQERAVTRQSETSKPWISLVAPWRPSFGPAWSPDGGRIAVAVSYLTRALVLVVDSQTGSPQEMPAPSGPPSGLDWLDVGSLVVNIPIQVGGPSQMFRLPYPSGPMSRLTNDPNDYVGSSLSSDRTSMVTVRREARMDVWVGDAGGTTGANVVERVPISVERLAWSGERLLYGGFVSGRPAILRVTPGGAAPEEVVLDALTPGVTSDGRTIVFVSSAVNEALNLWTADANGRRIRQLVPGVTAEQLVIAPDDRSVLYTSLLGGTISVWTVPIDGGTPTKLTDGTSGAVSADGATLAFTGLGPKGGVLSVCSLPGCTSLRTFGPVSVNAAIAWTPDGRGIAYTSEGNVWVQSQSGGAPRQLTRFTEDRPVASFAWSPDGKRLALTRSTVTNDIVLLSGLK